MGGVPEDVGANAGRGMELSSERGCRARLACLAGALDRAEPWGVWGGELLMYGAIVPHKRPRGRPRKDVVTIGASA